MASNTIRFSGLSSGLDTDSIVKALLTKEQNKIDSTKRKQTSLNWKKDTWKEMNTKISTFNTKYVDKLRLASTYVTTKATVSNESALSIAAGTTVEGTHEIRDVKLAKTARLTSGEIVGSGTITDTSILKDVGIPEGSFTLNGKTITVGATTTMGDLEKAMREVDSSLYVNFDEATKKMYISSNKFSTNIALSGDTAPGSLLAALKLTPSDVTGSATATKASCIYDNQLITAEDGSNVINVNGYTITLKQETAGPVTITSTKDIEGTTKFVKEFIDEYNKLIEDINTKLDTKKSRTYIPLTDAQKEKMSDKEIEKWEDKVKESLFYRDSALTEVRNMLRDQIGGMVNKSGSDYKVLSNIGITTGTWQENGKLYLDETKFTKALQTNPDEVINLLTGAGDEAAAAAAATAAGKDYNTLLYSEKRKWLASTNTEGIFTRISYQFDQLSKSSDLKSYGSFYNDKIDTEEAKDIVDNLLEYQRKYDAKEKALYAKFTAMEKAMSKMNSQQSSLTSILGQS